MLFIVQQLCHRYADKEISHGHGEGGGMLSSRHVYGPGKSHLCISAPRVGGERRPVGDSPPNNWRSPTPSHSNGVRHRFPYSTSNGDVLMLV